VGNHTLQVLNEKVRRPEMVWWELGDEALEGIDALVFIKFHRCHELLAEKVEKWRQ
jgi:hypothetical protein